MDQLWTIKTDCDPFKWIIPGIGAVGILPIFRCTLYRCPYCRWIFKIAWGPKNSLLGSEQRKCWHCRRVFWDGSNEWPEMSREEQELFLFPITIISYLGAYLVIPGLLVLGSFWAERKFLLGGALFLLVMFSPPLSAWFGFRAWQIHRSVRRYDERGARLCSSAGSVGDTDQEGLRKWKSGEVEEYKSGKAKPCKVKSIRRKVGSLVA